MPELHASSEVWIFVDGYDLTAHSPKSLDDEHQAGMEDTTGLRNNGWKTKAPTGELEASLALEGGFWDTAAGSSHAALQSQVPAGPDATQRVMCWGFEGESIGDNFIGVEGGYSHTYKVIAERGSLQKANAEFAISGERHEGVILQPLQQKSADWDTEASPVDNAASSANGGAGYLHVTQQDAGVTGFIGTLRDSPDDITYSDLGAFSDVPAAPAAQRLVVAGTVERYLAFKGDMTGTGNITVFCGFARG